MAAYFLDSSAAVKVYVLERGSAWASALLDPGLAHEIFVVRLTPVEIASAMFRRVRAGTLSPTLARQNLVILRHDADTVYRIVDVTPELTDAAIGAAERFGLRGYDCIQLSAAIVTRRRRIAAGLSPLVFVSADRELNDAALAEGFAVEDPSAYP